MAFRPGACARDACSRPERMSESPKVLRARLAALAGALAYHDHQYHALDTPEIDDAAYDALRRDYLALLAAHPELAPTDGPQLRVGSAPTSSHQEVTTVVP